MSISIYKRYPSAVLPERRTTGARGWDLHCMDPFTISPGEVKVVDTGLVIVPPPGFCIEVKPRSGLATKGIVVGGGVIDEDYCGPEDTLKVILAMLGNTLSARVLGAVVSGGCDRAPIQFYAGDRIAQFVLVQAHYHELVELPVAPPSKSRGGLGSTGR